MEEHIELQRRFLAMDGAKDPESIALQSYISAQLSGKEVGIGWVDIFATDASIVILGEPGSGKTEEMRAQMGALRRRGVCAALIELGHVVNAETPPLSHDDSAALARWRDGEADAWLFLDAVDESKLVRASDFHAALKRIAAWVGAQRGRTRYAISSRISEWRFGVDDVWVEQELLFDAPRKLRSLNDQPSASGRDQSRASRSKARSTEPVSTSQTGESDRKLKILKLLPLTSDQVLRFLQHSGGDPRAFLTAVERIDALDFVGRPLDARDLYAVWCRTGTLGTKVDMLEQSMEFKLRLKEDRSGIALSRLREGAETVSACLHLARKLTIDIEERNDGSSTDSIPLQLCLPKDWSDEERRSLIQRAIFDGATFGRIRLHHRTHQDYLTACWLRGLMEAECPYFQLRQLVFDDRRDDRLVLRPLMASVAAWLACIAPPGPRWVESFLADLGNHAPWIFLAHGDPQSLPISYRLAILRNIIEHFRGRTHVHVNWDTSTLKRFSDPALAGDLATWITDASISADIRADYIMLVRLGNLHDAMQPIVDIATSNNADEYLRATALGCIARIGTSEQRKTVLEAARVESRLPLRLAGWIAMCIYPGAADEVELFTILAKISTAPTKFSVSSLDQFAQEVVTATGESTVVHGEQFLRALVDFLRDGNGSCRKQRSWATDWLNPSIARLLRLPKLGPNESDLVIDALALLSSARELQLTKDWRSRNTDSLNDLSLHHPELRRSWFWKKYDDYCIEKKDDPTHPIQIGDYYDLLAPHPNDRLWWFKDALSNTEPKRPFALRSGLWLPRSLDKPGRSWPPFGTLVALLRDRTLRAIVRDALISDLSTPWHKIKQQWRWNWSRKYYWRHKWNPIREQYWHVFNKLHFLLKLRLIASGGWWSACYHVVDHARHVARDKSSSRWGGLDAEDIDRPYGSLVGKAIRSGIDKHWREDLPLLPHEKTPRNETSGTTVLGLVALDVAWSTQGEAYFAQMSTNDALRATRYALNELNGVPDWLTSLAAEHGPAVQAVFDEAIRGEWNSTPVDAQFGSDTLGRMEWNDSDLPRIAVPIVRSLLLDSAPANLTVLTQALRVVVKHDPSMSNWLAPLARERITSGTSGDQMSWTWLIVLMQIDADAAFEILEHWVDGQVRKTASEAAVRLCAALANRHQRSISTSKPDYLRPAFLARFIPWMYRYVRPEDDPVHDGAYSPTSHDDAARFRPQLVEALVTGDAEDAETVLHQLAAMPELVNERDWLTAAIDRRRASHADNLRLQTGDVFELRNQHERPPRSRADLFQIALSRILSFKDMIERDENSIRRNVGPEWKEKDYQFWIKHHLDAASRGRYVLPPEAEIDPGKFPDLRFEHPEIDGAISVEVKVADEWSHRELADALRNQLVGQYLRAFNANYGIYLLFHNGKKSQWIPDDQSARDWKGLLGDLQTLANQLRDPRTDIERLIVVGIDVRRPARAIGPAQPDPIFHTSVN